MKSQAIAITFRFPRGPVTTRMMTVIPREGEFLWGSVKLERGEDLVLWVVKRVTWDFFGGELREVYVDLARSSENGLPMP